MDIERIYSLLDRGFNWNDNSLCWCDSWCWIV